MSPQFVNRGLTAPADETPAAPVVPQAGTARAQAPRRAPLGLLVKRFPKLSETFVLEEVLGLERLGAELHIYTLEPPSDAIRHPAVARVRAPVTAVPAAARAGAGTVWRHLGLLLRRPWRYLDALRSALLGGREARGDFWRAGWLAVQLQRDGVEHLHTHFISTPADLAEWVARLGGPRFSLSAHAKDIYLSAPQDLRRKLAAARFTVTCTDFNCRSLRDIAPLAQVHRMYHGIDAEAFHPRRRASGSLVPLLLSVGRLREKKGLDTLVEACGLLAARGVPFRCEIIGYGEEQARLAARIEALDLGAQVRLVGTMPREGVIDRYARAAVYVQPSRVAADGDRDGIPNVLLEAMAMAVPVVATRVSGIPELVAHEHNGLLVEPDDPSAIADAVQRLIEDPALGAALARAARRTVTCQFDNDHNLQLLLRLLEDHHAYAVGRLAA